MIHVLRVRIQNGEMCGAIVTVHVIGECRVPHPDTPHIREFDRYLPKAVGFHFPRNFGNLDAPDELRMGIPACTSREYEERLEGFSLIRDVKVHALPHVAVSWEIDILPDSV